RSVPDVSCLHIHGRLRYISFSDVTSGSRDCCPERPPDQYLLSRHVVECCARAVIGQKLSMRPIKFHNRWSGWSTITPDQRGTASPRLRNSCWRNPVDQTAA